MSEVWTDILKDKAGTGAPDFPNGYTGAQKIEYVSSPQLLEVAKSYLFDTTASAYTVQLPSGPAQGDVVLWHDGKGNVNANNLTISRNGKNINGLANDLVVSTNFDSGKLVFIDTTTGWASY